MPRPGTSRYSSSDLPFPGHRDFRHRVCFDIFFSVALSSTVDTFGAGYSRRVRDVTVAVTVGEGASASTTGEVTGGSVTGPCRLRPSVSPPSPVLSSWV